MHKDLPEIYFDNLEFLLQGVDGNTVLGILGKNPSAAQILKFEICKHIDNFIDSKGLSLSEVQKLTGINSSDISCIKTIT
jgi:hypothetical protein